MKISIITLFPKMISGFFEESIIKRAEDKKLVEIEIINLRNFAIDDYGTVDDRPYGGGAGMVIRADVIYKAIKKITNYGLRIKNKNSKSVISNQKIKIILTSAKGKQFNQEKAQEYAELNHLVIIAGHYEGVDERVLDFIDEEVSVGDFVMTGGEIPAAAIVDSVIRLIPGVLKKDEATRQESFNINKKNLLEYPHYTRPENFRGKKVPKILLSGDHKKIEDWRIRKAVEETRKKRPDLLKSA
jgi:tRNA (guanine37-N1)-methyltransferase